MATLHFADAERLSRQGKPWTFRLECTVNGRNAFWLATGRARNEPVEIHYGGIGNKPQIIVKDWDYVAAKTPEKTGKGYDYTNTPFVRVRQATIDDLARKRKAAGLPVPKPTPKPATPTPKPATPPPAAPTKGGDPYSRVVQVCPTANGQWVAVDASGRQLFAMPKRGAMKLVQSTPAVTVGGLV